MIKIDDKEIRNPIEQIKKNMDDIEKLKDQIYEVYNYNGVIGSTEIPYVNRSSTNVPEDVNKGWLVDYTGKLFKITGGNTTTLLLDYYASIKGPTGNTGPQGPEGPQGDPGVGIVSIVKTSTSGLVDTYTITYTNGQQSTFTVTNGEKGDPGAPGPTYNAGDNIQINNSTKIISANENIIPKTNYGYDLGSATKLYKNVYAGGLKNTYFNILTGGVNGHGTAILSTTNAQGTTEGSLRLDYNKIQVNQKLVPSSNNTLDLGASYSKFDKIYVNTLSDGTNTIDVADIGTGSEYTAGDGIDITNDVISVDTDTVALKSDIPDVSDFVTDTELSTTLDDYELKADAFSGDYTDLTNKPTIPTVNNNRITLVQNGVSQSFTLNQNSDKEITLLTVKGNTGDTPTATLSDIQIGNTVYSIQGGGSGNSSSGIYLSSADLDTTVNYNKIILISTITLGSNTLAVDDIIIGANKYVGVVTSMGVNPNNQPVAAVKTLGNINDPDLSNYVTTTSLSTTLQDYELKADAFSGDYDDLTDKPDLSIYAESANLATVATSGSYTDLINKPSIPNVYNSTITIQKNGTDIDSFKLNQSTAKSINITVPTDTSDLTNNAGYITGIDSSDVTTALGYTPGTSNFSGDYDDLTDKPDLSIYAESSDLATVATTGDYDDLINKPDLSVYELAADAFSGDYADLTNKPTIPTQTSQLTNNSGFITKDVDDLTYYTKSSNLANVATSGSYNDLSNKPTIPAAQVNSDWNAVSGVAQILNKPSLATVATSGDYDDLTNKPTIPEAAYLIEITYGVTSGTLSATDLAALVADPTNVIFKTTWSGGFGYIPFQESDSNGSSIVYGIYWYNGANYAYYKITVNTSTGAWTTGGATFPTASTLATYIQKSSTAGLVKNDGTIDTNTYLTTAPVTSVNGQTGAVSLTIPEDATIINVSGTGGVLSASDFAKVVANPEKVIFIYNFSDSSYDNSYYLYFNHFSDDNVFGYDKYEYMSTMYYSKNYQIDISNNGGVGQYSIYEVKVNYNELSNKPTIPTTATSTVTPTGETLTFTYTDNTTATYTFLTAVSVSTTLS